MRIIILLLLPVMLSAQTKVFHFDSEFQSKKNGPDPDGCATACCLAMTSEAFYYFIDLLADHHTYILDNRDKFPDAVSLEGTMTFGGGQDEQLFVMPKVRGTWGVLSSEFRFLQMNSLDLSNYNVHQIASWQILQFNTYPAENFNLRFGSGLLFDQFEGETLFESAASIDLRFMDKRLSIIAEGRMAWGDLGYNDFISEVSLCSKIKLIETKRINSYVQFGGVYQNFYNQSEFSGISLGFSFMIH